MKKIRRLCIWPGRDSVPKMHALYEYHGKFGTTGSTILWFLEQPKAGSRVYGIHADSRYSPYMPGQAFRYAEFQAITIDAIYPDDFVICHA